MGDMGGDVEGPAALSVPFFENMSAQAGNRHVRGDSITVSLPRSEWAFGIMINRVIAKASAMLGVGANSAERQKRAAAAQMRKEMLQV